eukprot:s533_g11.t1
MLGYPWSQIRLTKVDSADVTCGDVSTSSAFCVAGAVQSSSTSCDRCATVIVEEDLNLEIYNLSGEIRWAPFGSSEAEELLLGGYTVSVIDQCGSELAVLGDVAVRSGFFRSGGAECCASDWYLLILTLEMVPRAATALAISAWQENLATTIPIFERTTTTSTTMTVTSSSTSTSTSSNSWTTVSTSTVTASEEASAMVEGCMTLSVSDAALFAESLDAKEAIRKMVSKVAAVHPLYVQDIRTYAGESCPGARRLEQRRLQEAMRFDYVIKFPASLGVELAVQAAETSLQLLQSATVQEVSQILVEEVQNVPSISNVVVSVTSISVPTVSVLGTSTTVMLPASDALPTSDDDILAVSAVFLGLFFPVSLFVVYRRCQKRSNAVDDGEQVKISVEAEQAVEETQDAKGDPPSGDEEGDKSVEPDSSKAVRKKKKKRLKPPRNKATESKSLTNTQVMVESSPAPPELEAIAISWLEDEGVIGLERSSDSAQLTPALPWEDVIFDRPNNTFVHKSRQSWLEVGVIHDRHVSRASGISHAPVMSQDELAAAGVLFDELDSSWRNPPETPLFDDVDEVSQKSAAGSSGGEEVTASLAPSESVQPKKVKKKVVTISTKVHDNTESEALEEENAENSTAAKPKRVRKKVVKKNTKESISTVNERNEDQR